MHLRKEKRREEIYVEEKNFETPESIGKVCRKTKELVFGGKIGMLALKVINYSCTIVWSL